MGNEITTSIVYDQVLMLPREQIGQHEQDSFELSLVLLGSGTRTIGGVASAFVRGDLALVPPGVKHCWRFTADDTDDQGRISNITVKFKPAFLAATAQLMPELRPALGRLLKLTHAVGFEGQKRQAIAKLLQAMSGQDDAGRLVNFMHVLVLMGGDDVDELTIGGLTEHEKFKQQREKLRTYLICNYMRPITLTDAAAHMGMSRSAFCAFVKQATGTTFVTHLNEMRLRQAKKLLLGRGGSELSVQEICYQCGFGSVAHFNHLFKASTGITPSDYRNGARKLRQ